MCSSSQCEVTDQGVAGGEQYDPVAGRLYKDEVEECTVILAATEALARRDNDDPILYITHRGACMGYKGHFYIDSKG